MDERRRRKAAETLDRLGFDLTANQDDGVVRSVCVMSADCLESGDETLTLDPAALRYACPVCGKTGPIEEALDQLERRAGGKRLDFADTAEFSAPVIAQQPAAPAPLAEIEPEPQVQTPQSKGGGIGEKLLISLLALVFLLAGLAAAGLSGFANYQAFSGAVADADQGRIWGAAGIIASVISFAGFTFFWWHASQRRRGEAVRSLIFALAGAATSLYGTKLYIENNNLLAQSNIAQAEAARPVLEAQIEDWRSQLAGIPSETRSVEGLEAYLAEVERVGRTHQKPYRDAQNELGLAKRRDDLQAKIETATAELLSGDQDSVLVAGPERRALPAWFFAGMLELFSSQGTSLGFVALLILFGRREL